MSNIDLSEILKIGQNTRKPGAKARAASFFETKRQKRSLADKKKRMSPEERAQLAKVKYMGESYGQTLANMTPAEMPEPSGEAMEILEEIQLDAPLTKSLTQQLKL